MTNSLFIGVDVSLQSNQICVLNFDQHKFFNLKFPNTPNGCEDAINKIKEKKINDVKPSFPLNIKIPGI